VPPWPVNTCVSPPPSWIRHPCPTCSLGPPTRTLHPCTTHSPVWSTLDRLPVRFSRPLPTSWTPYQDLPSAFPPAVTGPSWTTYQARSNREAPTALDALPRPAMRAPPQLGFSTRGLIRAVVAACSSCCPANVSLYEMPVFGLPITRRPGYDERRVQQRRCVVQPMLVCVRCHFWSLAQVHPVSFLSSLGLKSTHLCAGWAQCVFEQI
jgi:hypothetical protein